ncbi:hypothetical protein FGADI_1978 [Fusarium gaditjirri]|uniref:Uncharacterized protein n=1 Tax=Fusarium gaditjirri TaxID=282569 RepID=A0A8H4TJK5_9HYPO|nr:hypothetical protein FGADI_1978 [Fusarium gaditjirri]
MAWSTSIDLSVTFTAPSHGVHTEEILGTRTSSTTYQELSGEFPGTSSEEAKTTKEPPEDTIGESLATSRSHDGSSQRTATALPEPSTSDMSGSEISQEPIEEPSAHVTQTVPVGTANESPTGLETLDRNSVISSEALPGSTLPVDKTIDHPGLPSTLNIGLPTEAQSLTDWTNSDGVANPTTRLPSTITESLDTSTGTTSDQSGDDSATMTTSLGSKSSSVTFSVSQGIRTSETESEQSSTTASTIQLTTDRGEATSDTSHSEEETTPMGISSERELSSTTYGITTAEATPTTQLGTEAASTVISTVLPLVTTHPPSTKVPPSISVSVVTEAPPDFTATTVSGHPEWTSNTWITTTSGDSSQPTVVPILVGCKNCGGDGSGIILFHFPKETSTWFKFPGLPKFSFLCVPPGCTTGPSTSDPDEDGDDEDDEDSSSSVTCSERATVTDCFVSCTTYTGPAGESITPSCSTTCTETHTGCSVTGATTTSSTQACGPSRDSERITCQTSFDDELGSEVLRRRAIERRGGVDIQDTIGKCSWKGMPRFPAYPGGKLVLNNEAQIASGNTALNGIKRWWRTTKDSDCVPSLNHISEAQFPRGLADDKGPSIDHVYEKSMLLDFWNYIIDPNAAGVVGMKTGSPAKINCDDIKSYGGINSGTNLIQNVFDAFPKSSNSINPGAARFLEDFIGMDQWTNGIAKALVTTPAEIRSLLASKTKTMVDTSMSLSDVKKWILPKLDLLERMGIGVEMFNYQESIDALVRQSQRIYARLFTGTEDHSINQAVNDTKTQLLSDLQMDVSKAGNNPNVPATDLKSWKARLSNMADPNRAWAVTGVTWDWSYVSKRDGSWLSCDRPIPSATSEESTTFATSTRMASDESDTEEATFSSEETSPSAEDISSLTTQDNAGEFTGFPTLTKNIPEVTISTPEGSSCAETATYTQCALGTGSHGQACVERESCRSWINTETTSTTTSPTPTLAGPDPSQNEKHCYDTGQRSNYEAITYAAESFCRKVANDKTQGPVWSNYTLNDKEQPNQGYHFKLTLTVYEGCVWTADYDECMRYMRVPIDSCDCSAKGNKQGGWVENNCIYAKIDPNSGT